MLILYFLLYATYKLFPTHYDTNFIPYCAYFSLNYIIRLNKYEVNNIYSTHIVYSSQIRQYLICYKMEYILSDLCVLYPISPIFHYHILSITVKMVSLLLNRIYDKVNVYKKERSLYICVVFAALLIQKLKIKI